MPDSIIKPGERREQVSVALVMAALGVVFGDIGTSPLYAVRECFHHVPLNPQNILGAASLIFWALTVIISVKYLMLVMRADNRGEGGGLALMTLLQPQHRLVTKGPALFIVYLGILGASLLYGDSTITPAISVLSAIEGLNVATPFFQPYVVPLTLVLLVALFSLQSRGTARIGALFGPIILLWFISIGLLGVRSITSSPAILRAVNPAYAYYFFAHNTWESFLALGAIFLCLTGAESLFLDLGHFGLKPIRYGWFLVAMPGLLLNYFGQGALLLANPSAAVNPFYHLAPPWALYPLVLLATAATIIASQAVISGAFSLSSQAIKLGLLPRMQIYHTSSRKIGQVYIPQINWLLLALTIWLVLEFRSSSHLAAAYGIAVSTTMLITTILIFFVTYRIWKWPLVWGSLVSLFFFCIDLSFWTATMTKIIHGGWVPLVIGGAALIIMTTWHRGRQIFRQRLREKLPPLETFIDQIPEMTPLRVPGMAVYINPYRDVTPPALVYNIKNNRVVHDTVLIVTVEIEEIPYVSPVRRVQVEPLGRNFFHVTVRYGFMDAIDVPRALGLCKASGVEFDAARAVFFLGRESFSVGSKSMHAWRQKLFAFMARNPQDASSFFGIKPEQIIEIGFQVEL